MLHGVPWQNLAKIKYIIVGLLTLSGTHLFLKTKSQSTENHTIREVAELQLNMSLMININDVVIQHLEIHNCVSIVQTNITFKVLFLKLFIDVFFSLESSMS